MLPQDVLLVCLTTNRFRQMVVAFPKTPMSFDDHDFWSRRGKLVTRPDSISPSTSDNRESSRPVRASSCIWRSQSSSSQLLNHLANSARCSNDNLLTACLISSTVLIFNESYRC